MTHEEHHEGYRYLRTAIFSVYDGQVMCCYSLMEHMVSSFLDWTLMFEGGTVEA